jgi:hypothetical protein
MESDRLPIPKPIHIHNEALSLTGVVGLLCSILFGRLRQQKAVQAVGFAHFPGLNCDRDIGL